MRLFGIAVPIAPPRNPGEFDMRSYLARRDVHRALFVRYPEDGVLLRAGGGNPILSLAQRSRDWLRSTLCRGLDDSPEVQDFISGITENVSSRFIASRKSLESSRRCRTRCRCSAQAIPTSRRPTGCVRRGRSTSRRCAVSRHHALPLERCITHCAGVSWDMRGGAGRFTPSGAIRQTRP